jgi:hypothetical protein
MRRARLDFKVPSYKKAGVVFTPRVSFGCVVSKDGFWLAKEKARRRHSAGNFERGESGKASFRVLRLASGR